MDSADGIFNLAGTGALVAAAMTIGRFAYRTLTERIEELRRERDFWRDEARKQK